MFFPRIDVTLTRTRDCLVAVIVQPPTADCVSRKRETGLQRQGAETINKGSLTSSREDNLQPGMMKCSDWCNFGSIQLRSGALLAAAGPYFAETKNRGRAIPEDSSLGIAAGCAPQ